MNIDPLLAAVDCLDYPRALLLDRYLASHLYRLEANFRRPIRPKERPTTPPELVREAENFERHWEGDF
jgi:hypothetical protein